MKKKLLLALCVAVVSEFNFIDCAQEKILENEFVVVKKKIKKESVATVKEDIGQELELSLRQVNKNIAELADLQEKIFDKIKDLVGACDGDAHKKSVFDGSIVELQEQRHQLKKFHQKLLQQQDDVQSFLSCF